MDISFRMKSAAGAASAALLALLGGCTTLEGSTFDYENVDTTKPLAGIPFTINKPAPTIVRTPGVDGAPDKFLVTYSYVPDPKGSYTLQISPGLLSSVDFSMSFDAGGSLQETSAKANDQAGPFLQSFGKVALAAAALDKGNRDTKADTQDSIDIRDISARGNRFLADPSSRIVDVGSSAGRPVTVTDAAAFRDAMSRAQELATLNKVKKEFFYSTDQEFMVLRAIYAQYQAEAGAQIDTTGAEATLKSADSTIRGALLITEVVAAAHRGDMKPITRNRNELVAALQTERAQAEAKNWTTVDKTELIFKRLNFIKQVTAQFPESLALLASMVDVAPAEWQRRVVADLNVRIDAAAHENRILQSDAAKNRTHIDASNSLLAALQSRKAAVLGVAKEQARRQEIDRRLSSTSESRSLKLLHDERDELDGVIAAAEAALKPKAKDVKADDAIMARHFNVNDPVDDAGVMAELTRQQPGARPKYVVVTRRIGAAREGATGPGAAGPGAGTVTPGTGFGAGQSAIVPTVK